METALNLSQMAKSRILLKNSKAGLKQLNEARHAEVERLSAA